MRRVLAAIVCVILSPVVTLAASARGENFLVTAPNQADADAFLGVAEAKRKELAKLWTGNELPRWRDPCPVKVTYREGLKGGGATTLTFSSEGGVTSRSMAIDGERDYLLAHVLPHEVNHTVFADWFGKPVPRWADEGAAGTAQGEESKADERKRCVRALNAGDGIALSWLFKLREYPKDARQVELLYCQGMSVVEFLVSRKDHAAFMEYVGLAMSKQGDWNAASKAVYGFESVDALQSAWVEWLRANAKRAAAAPGSTASATTSKLGACGCIEPCVDECYCGCAPKNPDWVPWLAMAIGVGAVCVALAIRRGGV